MTEQDKTPASGNAAQVAPEAEVVNPETEPEPTPVTEASLLEALAQAQATGNFVAIAEVAAQISGFRKQQEVAELDAKTKALDKIGAGVKAVIDKALKTLIEKGDLNLADGIWYAFDFGETESNLRLLRGTAKKATTTASGTGKKYSVTSKDLLERFGNQMYDDTMTFEQAWKSNTDGNFRYAVRMKLLELDGKK